MLSRSVAEQEVLNLRKELSGANARLKNATNNVALEAGQRENHKVSHVTRRYEERFAELRASLEAECKKVVQVVDDTITFAQTGMEGFRNEERAAMTELKEEFRRQEDQAAELNAQLLCRVDELMEMLNIEELGQDEDGIRAEVFRLG